MIDYIDRWCGIWGRYFVGGNNTHTGYPRRSALHRMMTEHAPTTAANYRRRRHFVMTQGGGLVARDIEPMRASETHCFVPITEGEDAEAELMEEAMGSLRNQRHRDVARLKYMAQFDNGTSAKLMKLSEATYRKEVDGLHIALDAYLRALYPEVVVRMERSA